LPCFSSRWRYPERPQVSRWGRRLPYIFIGGVAATVIILVSALLPVMPRCLFATACSRRRPIPPRDRTRIYPGYRSGEKAWYRFRRERVAGNNRRG
jgi:hypothetical protein